MELSGPQFSRYRFFPRILDRRRPVIHRRIITPAREWLFLSRWDLVREVETKELQRTSMETKLRQLAGLMASGHQNVYRAPIRK
jgi:hypothetical protein